MKTCADCVHYGPCEDFAFGAGIQTSSAEKCKHVKDKSLIIEVPAKAGKTVYLPCKVGDTLNIETKTSENMSENKKIKAIYPHIVVSGDIDKPYYSIQWYDIEKKTMLDGYASYKLGLVKKWLQENFEVTDDDIGDFINRQKAEIEFKRKRIFHNTELITSLRNAIKILETRLNKAKSNAIKEFAERLKQKKTYDLVGFEIVHIYAIDNLVKEMVGDAE